MTEADVAEVFAVERASYQFPWSEGIFRDCLRVGYVCRVLALERQRHRLRRHERRCRRGAHPQPLRRRTLIAAAGSAGACWRYLLERGAAAGMSEAFLEVRPSNTAAIRLYQAIGFEQVGMRRGYYQAVGGREDAAVLRLTLRAPARST